MESNSKPRAFEVTINLSSAAPTLLRTLFLHHDGIIIGATISALQRYGLLDYLLKEKRTSMAQLLNSFPCNAGYLHVALRCLALQGWITRVGPIASEDMCFEITPAGNTAANAFDLYVRAGKFIYSGESLETRLFEVAGNEKSVSEYAGLVDLCSKGWGLPGGELFEIIAGHLDGMLAGPTMIAAKSRGLLDRETINLEDIAGCRESLGLTLRTLEHLGWLEQNDAGWVFTDPGKLACNFSLHYGLTLSYYPMLCQLPKLIFHSSKHVTHVAPGKEEAHVDRTLNVLASGVAHRRYFEDSDKIIIDIFNQEPLCDQPKFVADMGCGDGAWLKRIYEVVRLQTIRGKHLDTHPLVMVGADYNIRAQEVSDNLLSAAGIPHIVLFGDVTEPAQFNNSLKQHGIDIRSGLHIRAFIDHNRRYVMPLDQNAAHRRTGLSSGAYADEDGNPIPNRLLEQNLVEHFKKWAPYIRQHGLIVIEAHNVEPEVACRYNGKTHATAFDTYHGYSNQYPLEFEAFMQLAEEAGLRSISYQQSVYPSRLPFVAISINRFRTAQLSPCDKLRSAGECGTKEWIPNGSEDLLDGEALHRFLYEEGDITRPKRWCFGATGMLVESILREINIRVQKLKNTEPERRTLTLIDYGAGTGLATLELIKGLNETGLLQQIQEGDITFKLLLFDFPSGWFCKGYELLKQFSFVEFYSLQNTETSKIRLITEILEHRKVDIIVASMVLHLVPAHALPVLFESLYQALKNQGTLLWNSPDTTPTPRCAEVIHATNRALRKTFLAVIGKEQMFLDILERVPIDDRHAYADLPEIFKQLKNRLTPALRIEAQNRADKQILPESTHLDIIKKALSKHFIGTDSTLISLLRDRDIVDLALLPANQRYLNEIDDAKCRERVINLLLRYEIIPKFRARTAGHPKGINLHWVFGRYTPSLEGSS